MVLSQIQTFVDQVLDVRFRLGSISFSRYL